MARRLPPRGVKIPTKLRFVSLAWAGLAFTLVAAAGCSGAGVDANCGAQAQSPTLALPLRIALADHTGDSATDAAIRAAQRAVRERPDVVKLERLATLFISKARSVGDPGFYRLAEACADAMPESADSRGAAMLIRGHVRHALHDFAAAEQIARELVAERGMFLDLGLLGDVLLDRGDFDEARDVYQRMLDLKPCLQSYARAAQVRWLMGDLDGSRELLDMAAGAGSRRAPEPVAWVLARRAALELQANDPQTAARFAERALDWVPDYPAALAWRGRAALAMSELDSAVSDLRAAAQQSPLPEHQWALAEAMRAAGDMDGAHAVEQRLTAAGEREDPRTFALWLASTDGEPVRALTVAQTELAIRADCYTLDVLALARYRVGNLIGARDAMQQALAIGVRDARVSLHAALIAAATGEVEQARKHVDLANARLAALLPSEQQALARVAEQL